MTAKAHGGPIEIFGITVAKVDDKVRLQAIDTWMDPLAMFRQIAPQGIVNKYPMNTKVDKSEALDVGPGNDGIKIAEAFNQTNGPVLDAKMDESDILQQVGGCPFMKQSGAECEVLPEGHPHIAAQVGIPNSAPEARLDNRSIQMDIDTPAPALSSPANNVKPDGNSTIQDAEEPTTLSTTDQLQPKRSAEEPAVRNTLPSSTTNHMEDSIKIPRRAEYTEKSVATRNSDTVDRHLQKPAEDVHPHPKSMEDSVKPGAGEAVAAPALSQETVDTVREMSHINPDETETIMNRE